MDFSTNFELNFDLGGQARECDDELRECDFIPKKFSNDLDCYFSENVLGTGSDSENIVSMVRDGKCVTAQLIIAESEIDHTFLGVPLRGNAISSPSDFASRLQDQGIEAVVQNSTVVLPDGFVTIEFRDSICWWDRGYWSFEEFIDNTILI